MTMTKNTPNTPTPVETTPKVAAAPATPNAAPRKAPEPPRRQGSSRFGRFVFQLAILAVAFGGGYLVMARQALVEQQSMLARQGDAQERIVALEQQLLEIQSNRATRLEIDLTEAIEPIREAFGRVAAVKLAEISRDITTQIVQYVDTELEGTVNGATVAPVSTAGEPVAGDGGPTDAAAAAEPVTDAGEPVAEDATGASTEPVADAAGDQGEPVADAAGDQGEPVADAAGDQGEPVADAAGDQGEPVADAAGDQGEPVAERGDPATVPAAPAEQAARSDAELAQAADAASSGGAVEASTAERVAQPGTHAGDPPAAGNDQ